MTDVFTALRAGLAHHQAGRAADAEAQYRAALALEPEHAYALYLFGLLRMGAGRLDEAVDLLRRSVAADPTGSDARFNLGNALFRKGDFGRAVRLYREVTAERPGNAEAFANLARALKESGQTGEAIVAGREAVRLQPALVEGHTNLGAAFLAADDTAGAVAAFRTAVELQPKSAAAHANLANALRRSGDAAAAAGEARAALALNPNFAEAHAALGMALRDSGDYQDAADALARAAALAPEDAQILLNLGNAQMDVERVDDAVASYRRAAALAPTLAEAHSNLSAALTAAGSYDEAIAASDRAIALKPDHAEAHWNQGFAYLLKGDLANGWEKYEWRKRHPRFAAAYRHFPQPVWEGEDPAGRTLMIHAEQGFGDSIQLVRYAPLLAARGATVIVACDRALVGLFVSVAGVAAAIDKRGPLPDFDLWIDQMSLPRVFKTRADTVPATVAPYLVPDPTRMEAWRSALPAGRKFGLVWSGNPTHSNDRRRSAPVDAVAPLLDVPGFTAVSLQVGPRAAADIARFAPRRIVDLAPRLTDFMETASAIANLDLVITVDTAVAHLAGALARPVWVMLPFAPDWRWIAGRDDTPWYPTMRLFRQEAPGDWAGVVTKLVDALRGIS